MIIDSLLKTDLYKFTMAQFVFHQGFSATVKYRFKCRNAKTSLLFLKYDIEKEMDHLCTLQFTKEELSYLKSIPDMKDDFVDFLEDFRLKRRYVHIDEKNGDLDIWIEGPFLQTIMFEVYILKLVHEVYSCRTHMHNPNFDYVEGYRRLDEKIELLIKYGKPIIISDFGTRRAFSDEWHEYVIEQLYNNNCINSTSNVYYAMKYGIKPVGTMAHEIVMAGQAMGPRLVDSQKYILQKWADEYRGSLSIALSDTLGFDKFLKDFDLYFAKLYDGCRHDSGNPFKWVDKLINHYKNLGIDPMTKKAVFSDGLDIPKAIELNDFCEGRIQCSFGIGTNLTNDLGVSALQNVIKLIEYQGQPVAKLSDNPAKTMCEDDTYMKNLNYVIKQERL